MSNDGLLAFGSENFEVKVRRACKNEVNRFPAQVGFSGFKWCSNHLIIFLFFLVVNILVDHFLVSGLEGGVWVVCEIGFEVCRESGEQSVSPTGANIEHAFMRFVSQKEVVYGSGERGFKKIAFHVSVFFGKHAVQFIKRFSQIEACEMFLVIHVSFDYEFHVFFTVPRGKRGEVAPIAFTFHALKSGETIDEFIDVVVAGLGVDIEVVGLIAVDGEVHFLPNIARKFLLVIGVTAFDKFGFIIFKFLKGALFKCLGTKERWIRENNFAILDFVDDAINNKVLFIFSIHVFR